MVNLFAFLPALASVIFSGLLAWHTPDSSAWGWFLFVAVLLAYMGVMATAAAGGHR
ncbi:hypothetical protein AB4037_23220 [Labrys sp. KB_33_2]